MRTSHVMTYVTKQNMNVMVSTFCAEYVNAAETKIKFWKINIILKPKCSLHSN